MIFVVKLILWNCGLPDYNFLSKFLLVVFKIFAETNPVKMYRKIHWNILQSSHSLLFIEC